MILSDHYTQAVVNPIHDAFFGPGLPYIFGAVYAVHRLVDARAEIAAVNEAMTRARRLPYISHSCACGFCDCE